VGGLSEKGTSRRAVTDIHIGNFGEKKPQFERQKFSQAGRGDELRQMFSGYLTLEKVCH